MPGQLEITLVDHRLIAVCLFYCRFQVIRYQQARDAAEELEGPHMCHQPAFLVLVFAGFDVGMAGCTQSGDGDLGVAYHAGIWIDHRYRRAAEVQEQVLAGGVKLAHATLLFFKPLQVKHAELRVAIGVIGLLLLILLPEQEPGHAFAFKFMVTSGDAAIRQMTIKLEA